HQPRAYGAAQRGGAQQAQPAGGRVEGRHVALAQAQPGGGSAHQPGPEHGGRRQQNKKHGRRQREPVAPQVVQQYPGASPGAIGSNGNGRRNGRHAQYRTRGSSTAYSRSIRMFRMKMAVAVTRMVDCTTAKSRWMIESIISLPMPGQPNTDSTMTAPLTSPVARSPATVMTGSSELRRAWPNTTDRGASPLARAVLM